MAILPRWEWPEGVDVGPAARLPLPLTPLEVACGAAFDLAQARPHLPLTRLEPFDALQEAVLPALQRAPCIVSFSGGVDSSLVLAAATVASRRDGLPPPVPVTLRYSGAVGAGRRASTSTASKGACPPAARHHRRP